MRISGLLRIDVSILQGCEKGKNDGFRRSMLSGFNDAVGRGNGKGHWLIHNMVLSLTRQWSVYNKY